jgi:hypothetical protein
MRLQIMVSPPWYSSLNKCWSQKKIKLMSLGEILKPCDIVAAKIEKGEFLLLLSKSP